MEQQGCRDPTEHNYVLAFVFKTLVRKYKNLPKKQLTKFSQNYKHMDEHLEVMSTKQGW